MSISERDRETIVATLDSMEAIAARIIIATVEAFTRWLANELPNIFRKIRDQIRRIWESIKAFFADG